MKDMIYSRIKTDVENLPKNYKTKDVDALIKGYVKERLDVSSLRDIILTEQMFHRIYFHTSLLQIKEHNERLKWIDKNLLFGDWWHTDQIIGMVKNADFEVAHSLAKDYVLDEDPFVRRWGYVMFISKLCRDKEKLSKILELFHDDEHYYVQMGEAWLIAELAVFFPDEIRDYLSFCGLSYKIVGKAIQKICDSYRIKDKESFKLLRNFD